MIMEKMQPNKLVQQLMNLNNRISNLKEITSKQHEYDAITENLDSALELVEKSVVIADRMRLANIKRKKSNENC